MDPQRRAQLLAVKLAALAGAPGAPDGGGVGGGAALVHEGCAWVLLDQPAAGRGLGAALAWALRQEATSLVVLAEAGTGVLARRAAGFTFPIEVRHVEGRDSLPAVAEPLPVCADVPAAHRVFEADIRAGGAEPVVEHGVLGGEVSGLEVCRVVTDPHTGAERLDVGIGADDREMFQVLHGDKPTVEALTEVVRFVGAQRWPGAPRHPLNLLAQERMMRCSLVADPSLIGASSVVPAPPPVPRANLKDAVPCVASAVIDGRTVAVVCSVGVDLDVVPFAVDACALLGVGECRIVVPVRDALAVQHRLAALARPRITVVGIGAVA
jgi:hypothetical protein